MNKLIVYLAGAMETYENTDKAEKWRMDVTKYFVKNSEVISVVDPTTYYTYGKGYHKTDKEVFRFDLYKVRKSDVVLVNLADIRKSIGTCIEVYEAHRSRIPVIGFLKDVQEDKIKDYIHPWIYHCMDRIETGEDCMENACNYIKAYYG